eukprot:TRINITY_DN3250_c0_g2_i3.p1 TRINITY_DN3250_c0_g2~~TRINITY_DN3250_c0_g2_i3.p1  ORF type:complete len:900 (-),score=148.88 TRINITY_DN3250_c0_g2_i3:566-3055(-)
MEKLHILQGNCKKDPEGYYDEFQTQFVRYKSFLETVKAQPASASEDFKRLIEFISHVADKYKEQTADYPKDLCDLLETYNEQLDAGVRKTLVLALILLKRKNLVQTMTLLPLFFKLFNVQDKELRKILQTFIVTDIKKNNKKGGGNSERALQGFLFKQVDEGQERAAKRALAIVIELWRTFVWRNARTVSVIAYAVQHDSHSIMLAALKFFLGQDQKAAEDDDEDSDEENAEMDKNRAVSSTISKSDFYNAKNRGTVASKKKKQARLQRAVNSVKKAVRKERENQAESFAAIQLIHDPQEFAEKLFSRLSRERSIKFETKVAMMKVISRSIGVHKLMLINFYPMLQKYMFPSQKDVTQVLAALVQSCHDVVPPDVLQPVLRQLVDNFVHDRARPEVMTIGLKTVRQICERCPLIMNEDLLQDLTQYQTFKHKDVSSAARGLIGLFRQLAPSMLKRKDRGRSADLKLKPMEYGMAISKTRVEGAELLEKAMQQGILDEDGNIEGDLQEEDDEGDAGQEDGSEEDKDESQSLEGDSNGTNSNISQFDIPDQQQLNQESLTTNEDDEYSEEESDENENENEDYDDDESDIELNDNEDGEEIFKDEDVNNEKVELRQDNGTLQLDTLATKQKSSKVKEADPESLASLRKQLTGMKREREQSAQIKQIVDEVEDKDMILEQKQFISQEEFETIKDLRRAQLIREALRKHGLMSSSKKRKLQEEAEAYADAVMALEKRRAAIGEYVTQEGEIVGQHKGRTTKEQRMESILKGREGREEFKSRAARRKQKSNASMSNKEKERKKALPTRAKKSQIKRRQSLKRKRSAKNFKGRVTK